MIVVGPQIPVSVSMTSSRNEHAHAFLGYYVTTNPKYDPGSFWLLWADFCDVNDHTYGNGGEDYEFHIVETRKCLFS